MSNQLFKPGSRFLYKSAVGSKYGTVRYLRDDTYEKNMRATDCNHYYYHVDFDDGSFETYLYQAYMSPV